LLFHNGGAMTLPLVFVMVSCVALLLIFYLFVAGRSTVKNLDELAARLQPLDVGAFHNLIDEREESFLRERLSSREFRSVHRERMLAAVDYAWGAARNAGILIRLAEAAKADPDPAVAAAAASLLENATHLRLYVFRTVPRLYLSMLLPYVDHAPRALAESYDMMTRQMVMLRCLRSPNSRM
jgi:hypothetical protein